MNILLCCAGGMSTSLLVTKMEKAAAEQGFSCCIRAVGAGAVRRHMDEADVVLLGPQVRYLLPELRALGKVPVDFILPAHYGVCNGAAVLEMARKLKEEQGWNT